MPKFLISFFFLVGLFPLMSRASAVHRAGAELLNAKAYSIMVETSLFKNSAYFDDQGTVQSFPEGSSYRMIDTDFKMAYGISSNLEASLFGKFRSVSSNDGTNNATHTGPESLGVLAKYSFGAVRSFRYAIGLRYRQTLYTNTRYLSSQIPPVNEVILGDDGSEYGVDFYATYLGHPWKIDLMAGYNSPPNDLSSEIVYKAEALYLFTRLGLFAGVEGIYSLKRDQFTDSPLSKPLMSTGQTKQFNSLNREKVAPYLGGQYAFDKFLFSLKGQSIVSGRSTDRGNLILASLSFSSEGITPESIKIESFKEYHVDGSVLKVSARGNFIKIDQGLATDVEKGMKFDIYQTDYFGGNVLVASGVAYDIGSDWAVIKLTKKYKDIEIKPGFAARGY
ncbi:MAG: hypothetical protein ACXVLQ_05900 [Bacteriovorax sp.]